MPRFASLQAWGLQQLLNGFDVIRQVNGQTAKEISEMILALTAKALLTGSFDQFAHWFHLPHTIETPDCKSVLRTEEDMKVVFDSVTDDYRQKRVTDLVRICEVAEFQSEKRVVATHITHMMAGNQRVNDPFPNLSVLEFIGGRWQATSTQYAVDRYTTVGRALARVTAANPAQTGAAQNEEDKR